MVRFYRTAPRIIAAAAMAVMSALTGGAPVSAAPAPPAGDAQPTWALVDVGQRLCASPDDPRTLYYFVILDGTWTVPVTARYTGMPAGTEVYGPLAVQPGSGDGHVVQALAAFRLHGAAPGRYVPELRATDGAAAQRVPVVLEIRASF